MTFLPNGVFFIFLFFKLFTHFKDIEISETCKLILLDFLCIHNSNDLPPKAIPEELIFLRTEQRSAEYAKNLENTWK